MFAVFLALFDPVLGEAGWEHKDSTRINLTIADARATFLNSGIPYVQNLLKFHVRESTLQFVNFVSSSLKEATIF